ncbi:MAG: T9SS type A sorting domain-containing protein [Bacteroidia bacterium]
MKLLTYKAVFIILIIFKIGLLQAQPYFRFSMDTLTYKEIDPSFGVFKDEFWNTQTGQSRMLPLPFTFNFFGVNYTSTWISKAGGITFFHPQSFLANRIYFFNTYYTEKSKKAPFVSSITVNTIASGADSIFKIQYKNVGFERSKDTSGYANFQLWLYKNSNVFEIHFGDIKADSTAWLNPYGAYVGIGKDEQSILVLLGGPSQNPKWMLHRDTMLLNIPAPNTIYRFTPISTSIEVQNKIMPNIIIYPNPAINEFLVQTDLKLNLLEIYNLNGQMVKKINVLIDDNKFDISELKKGIYLIKIYTINGNYYKKLVVD